MEFAIPAAKAILLESLVATLRLVPNIAAIALGGSHARGSHRPDSDIDLGLYYREAAPFVIDAIRHVARQFCPVGEPTVTDFYGWGPFVNGGAWIVNPVSKIDFLYRNLDQLDRVARALEGGNWEHSYDQQPPFGFRSVTSLGEIHVCRPLYDPDNLLAALKARVGVFPPALKTRIVQDTLWGAEFSLFFAEDFARSGDVPNAVGCITRIFHYLEHALFALNETYLLNDKRVLPAIEGFPLRPRNFVARMTEILGRPGYDAAELSLSLEKLRLLCCETIALTDGLYVPKFPVPRS